MIAGRYINLLVHARMHTQGHDVCNGVECTSHRCRVISQVGLFSGGRDIAAVDLVNGLLDEEITVRGRRRTRVKTVTFQEPADRAVTDAASADL